MRRSRKSSAGFTLIEMSIVLVIIGLIIGGVLVGQDLINAAAIRSQITQIEKYNTAVNTFRGKYNDFLPGDIPDPQASNFGFSARGPYPGQGDGNGVIQSNWNNTSNSLYTDGGYYDSYYCYCAAGEEGLFWVDLSTANLIDGSFSLATATGLPTTHNVAGYFPSAKLGTGNYILAITVNGSNYYAISAMFPIPTNPISGGSSYYYKSMTVNQAYGIDSKVDDGFPVSGKVIANSTENIFGTIYYNFLNLYSPDTTTASASATTCYNNGGVNGATQQYSVESTVANNINCALSFKFQ